MFFVFEFWVYIWHLCLIINVSVRLAMGLYDNSTSKGKFLQSCDGGSNQVMPCCRPLGTTLCWWFDFDNREQGRSGRNWLRRLRLTTYTLMMSCVLIARMHARCSLPRQLGPSLGSVTNLCSAIFYVFIVWKVFMLILISAVILWKFYKIYLCCWTRRVKQWFLRKF